MPLYQVTIHKFWIGSYDKNGHVKPLHHMAHYTYAPPFEPETKDFNKVASHLVFIERFMTADDVEFGRVVFLETNEGNEGYDQNTVTITCIAFPGIDEQTGAPGRVMGLRPAENMDFFRGASITRNAVTGPAHKRYFPGSLGRDDVTQMKNPAYRADCTQLATDGPFCWGIGWWRYWTHTLNYVDPSREFDRSGRKVQYEPYVSQHLIQASHEWLQWRRSWAEAPDVVAAWHKDLYDRDQYIQSLLWHYREYMEGRRVDRYSYLWPNTWPEALTAIHRRRTWEQYAKYFYSEVAVGTKFNAFTEVSPRALTDGRFKTKLKLKRDEVQVLGIVNRLFQVHQHYCEHSPGRIEKGGHAVSQNGWAFDMSSFNEVWYWTGLKSFRGQSLIYGGLIYLWNDEWRLIGDPEYYVKLENFLDSIYDEVTRAFFFEISMSNILDQVVSPANRRVLTTANVPQPRPSFSYRGDPPTYPTALEMVPYVAIQPYKRPPWPRRQYSGTTATTWGRVPNPTPKTKRENQLPNWWRGATPEPDYQGAKDALDDFTDDLYGGIDEAARNAWNSTPGYIYRILNRDPTVEG
jgi:hypothetical protein